MYKLLDRFLMHFKCKTPYILIIYRVCFMGPWVLIPPRALKISGPALDSPAKSLIQTPYCPVLQSLAPIRKSPRPFSIYRLLRKSPIHFAIAVRRPAGRPLVIRAAYLLLQTQVEESENICRKVRNYDS
jgi:hypothetical protein